MRKMKADRVTKAGWYVIVRHAIACERVAYFDGEAWMMVGNNRRYRPEWIGPLEVWRIWDGAVDDKATGVLVDECE